MPCVKILAHVLETQNPLGEPHAAYTEVVVINKSEQCDSSASAQHAFWTFNVSILRNYLELQLCHTAKGVNSLGGTHVL